MTLTPLDIRRHQFAKALRGYDPAEVDAFLKQISEQNEGVLDQLRQARERVEQMETKLAHYERVELALQEALESSKEAARRAEETAKARAGLIVEQAELQARSIVQDAERAQYGLRQDITRLSTRRAEVAARLRAFLVSELEVLGQFQGDGPAADRPAPATLPEPPALPSGHDWSDVVPTADAPAPPAPPAAAESATPPAPAGPSDGAGGDGTPPADAASDVPADHEAMWANEPAWAEPEPDDLPLTDAWPATDVLLPTDDAPDGASPDAAAPDAPASADEGQPDEAPPADADPEGGAAPESPAAGGWDLRSLVTGGGEGTSSEAERDRIRKILDDLD